MLFDPNEMNPRDAYQLLIGSVVPRPIAFVSSVAADGTFNLAPFSFFMGLTGDPPTVAVSINRKGARRDKAGTLTQAGQPKDSLSNIEDAGEFVINLVNEEIAEAMNKTSADFPPDVDEFKVSGLTPVPAKIVRAPRVAESPINMECRLQQVVNVGREGSQTGLVIAEVLLWHIKDEYVTENGRIDVHKLQPVARLSANWYSTTRDLFEMVRPVWQP